jgi:hypothetical protein
MRYSEVKLTFSLLPCNLWPNVASIRSVETEPHSLALDSSSPDTCRCAINACNQALDKGSPYEITRLTSADFSVAFLRNNSDKLLKNGKT